MNMNDMMRAAMTGKGDYSLDAVKSEQKKPVKEEPEKQAKTAAKETGEKMSGAETFYTKKTALEACNMLNHWATDDSELDDGESQSDRLYAYMIGVVDQDKNGTMSNEEQAVFDLACEAVSGYLIYALGADEEDSSALMNDWDDDAAERVREFIKDSFDSEELVSMAHDYALSDDGDVTMDAAESSTAYKSFIVFHNGVKGVARKRIRGHVRVTPAQHAAIEKAQKASHTSSANKARLLSIEKREKLGIKPHQIG
jgi:hypothetical protein